MKSNENRLSSVTKDEDIMPFQDIDEVHIRSAGRRRIASKSCCAGSSSKTGA
jgi:hypothetical protein